MSSAASPDLILADSALERISSRLRELEADSKRLQFLITEGANVVCADSLPEPRYRLEWPALGEWQSSWQASPREAIDIAMEDAAT